MAFQKAKLLAFLISKEVKVINCEKVPTGSVEILVNPQDRPSLGGRWHTIPDTISGMSSEVMSGIDKVSTITRIANRVHKKGWENVGEEMRTELIEKFLGEGEEKKIPDRSKEHVEILEEGFKRLERLLVERFNQLNRQLERRFDGVGEQGKGGVKAAGGKEKAGGVKGDAQGEKDGRDQGYKGDEKGAGAGEKDGPRKNDPENGNGNGVGNGNGNGNGVSGWLEWFFRG